MHKDRLRVWHRNVIPVYLPSHVQEYLIQFKNCLGDPPKWSSWYIGFLSHACTYTQRHACTQLNNHTFCRKIKNKPKKWTKSLWTKGDKRIAKLDFKPDKGASTEGGVRLNTCMYIYSRTRRHRSQLSWFTNLPRSTPAHIPSRQGHVQHPPFESELGCVYRISLYLHHPARCGLSQQPLLDREPEEFAGYLAQPWGIKFFRSLTTLGGGGCRLVIPVS